MTTISKAKSIIRDYLFVVGLSSQLYPGSPEEDYIILDQDYKDLGYEGSKPQDNIKEKKKDLNFSRMPNNNKMSVSLYLNGNDNPRTPIKSENNQNYILQNHG